MPKLLVNEGGQASVFELFDDEATIGRGASNAIQIADGHASKNHAVVRRVGGRMKLVDLESKNGTRVNGEFRNQRWLQHGDAISVGASVLTYDGADATAAAPGAPSVGFAPASAAAVAAPLVSSRGESSRSGGPRSGRSTSRRARDEGADEGDEAAPRRVPRRSSNSGAIGALVGLGLLGVIAIFFLLLKGGGLSQNVKALAEAQRLRALGGKENAQRAMDHLTMYGDPADPDGYGPIVAEIASLKEKVLQFDDTDMESKAAAEYKALERAFIEKHMNGRTEESLGADLLRWVNTYKEYPSGTGRIPGRQVGAFLAGYKNPKLLNLYRKTLAAGK